MLVRASTAARRRAGALIDAAIELAVSAHGRFATRAATRGLTALSDWELAHDLLDKNAYYDRLTKLAIARVVSPASVCIDVGCHEGAILKEMLRRAPRGRALAFEPLPHLACRLAANFEHAPVRVYDVALSDEAGRATFNFVVSNPGYSGLRKRRYDRALEAEQQIEVTTDTLDAVLAREGVTKVSFIKIDVEGAEHLVLRGALRTLRDSRPVVVFEHGLGASDCYGSGPREVFALLAGCGLRVSLIPDWLRGRPPLSASAFERQYSAGENYYFVAHP